MISANSHPCFFTMINPFVPSGLSYINSLDKFISIIVMYYKIVELNANSVDPDQTPRSSASDLGLHCLPISLLWDARLIWVNFVVSRIE